MEGKLVIQTLRLKCTLLISVIWYGIIACILSIMYFNKMLIGLGRSGGGSFSSLAFSYSHCPASTSCLVDPPILPAWPISVLLKYMIDRIQIILPYQVLFFFLFLKIYLFIYKNYHFLPSSQYPSSPPTPSPPPSPVPRAVRVSCPVGSSRSSPLPPGLGRCASKQTRTPKSQNLQWNQNPMSLSLASQSALIVSHIQRIRFDHMLVQSQSSWPW